VVGLYKYVAPQGYRRDGEDIFATIIYRKNAGSQKSGMKKDSRRLGLPGSLKTSM
jgi:hypothetical protein